MVGVYQGMDSENERKVMQTLLRNSRYPSVHSESRYPQYFVITPTLLPSLDFSNAHVTFLIVFSSPRPIFNSDGRNLTGEELERDHVAWNSEAFIAASSQSTQLSFV